MKYSIYFLTIPLFLAACQAGGSKNTQADAAAPVTEASQSAGEQVDTANAARFSFTGKTHDFGKVEEGEKVKYAFEFVNSGKSTLIITRAMASCGCTVPQWTREPIAPGESGKIEVVFDSQGRPGVQTKEITVYANTHPAVEHLYLKGEVVAKEKSN